MVTTQVVGEFAGTLQLELALQLLNRHPEIGVAVNDTWVPVGNALLQVVDEDEVDEQLMPELPLETVPCPTMETDNVRVTGVGFGILAQASFE